MSLMLKRGIEVLVGMALVVAMLAVLPAMAEAQGMADMAATQDARSVNRSDEAASVVVRPGDSLWSISEEHLDPNATPRQIASDVEQIYALNQGRIGADPDLILPGQSLLLPPVAARNPAEPAESSLTRGGIKSGTERASSTAVGEVSSKAGRTSGAVAEPVALPDMPTKQVTPKVSLLSVTDAPSPVESFGRTARGLLSSVTSAIVGLFPQDPLLGRKLFGLGIMLLTLIVGGLLAWKLPLKRNFGVYEVWGIPTGYVGNHTRLAEATARYGDTPELVPALPVAEPGWGSVRSEAPVVENDTNNAWMIAATLRRYKRSIRERARGSRRLPHGDLATDAHNLQVSRRLRCARNRISQGTVAGSPRIRRRSALRKTRATMAGAGEAFAGTRGPTSQPESWLGRRWEAVDPDTKRALLVARHALFREGLATVLEWREGFKVAQAESLAAVLRILRTLDAEPQIAVVDLELSSGAGVELIREIHETWPHVPILALTIGRDPERATRAKEAGAGEVLSTAVSSEELVEGVRRLSNS